MIDKAAGKRTEIIKKESPLASKTEQKMSED